MDCPLPNTFISTWCTIGKESPVSYCIEGCAATSFSNAITTALLYEYVYLHYDHITIRYIWILSTFFFHLCLHSSWFITNTLGILKQFDRSEFCSV